MAQQLKRWESPRRKGRNHKGRGGSAKQRQYIKRQKRLRQKLQTGINLLDNHSHSSSSKERDLEVSNLGLFLFMSSGKNLSDITTASAFKGYGEVSIGKDTSLQPY